MLEKQIRESIQENLPKLVGDELVKRLQEAKETEEELKKVRDKLEGLQKVYDEISRQLGIREKEIENFESNATMLKNLEVDLDKKRKALLIERLSVSETILESKNVSLEQHVKDMKELVSSVFRNKTLVESITHNYNDSKSYPNPDPNQYGALINENKSGGGGTTTTKEEK